MVNRLVVVLLLATLLACKRHAPTPAPAVAPGDYPASVLELARKQGKAFDGRAVRVTGTVLEVRPGGGDVPECFDLAAGQGERLPGCMRLHSCITGLCSDDAPRVGATATLECTGDHLLKRAMLTKCTRPEQ